MSYLPVAGALAIYAFPKVCGALMFFNLALRHGFRSPLTTSCTIMSVFCVLYPGLVMGAITVGTAMTDSLPPLETISFMIMHFGEWPPLARLAAIIYISWKAEILSRDMTIPLLIILTQDPGSSVMTSSIIYYRLAQAHLRLARCLPALNVEEKASMWCHAVLLPAVIVVCRMLIKYAT